MMDDPPGAPAETPMQRALRLKKAAQGGPPKGAGDAKLQRRSAAMPTGVSKPWMKK
jgi:hypothetical protein